MVVVSALAEHGADALGRRSHLLLRGGAERAADAGEDLAEIVAGARIRLPPEPVRKDLPRPASDADRNFKP